MGEHERRIAARLAERAEEIRHVDHRLQRFVAVENALPDQGQALTICSTPACRGSGRERRLYDHQRFPHVEKGDIVKHQRTSNACAHLPGGRPNDDHPLGAAAPTEKSRAVEFAQGLTNSRAIDSKLTCELEFRWQTVALLESAGDDIINERRCNLTVSRLHRQRIELHVHAVSLKTSRPMSMRRISWVPAPIS